MIKLDSIVCEKIRDADDSNCSTRYRLTLTHEFEYGTPSPNDEDDCKRIAQLMAKLFLYKPIRELAEKIENEASEINRLSEFHGEKREQRIDFIKSLAVKILDEIPRMENEGHHF